MKIALVTGANKGMGFEVARQLGKQGVHVLLGSRDEAKGKAAIEKLKLENINAEYLALDMDNESSIKQAAEFVNTKYGQLDILINNAAINPEYPLGLLSFEALPTDVLTSIFNTNFFGPFITTREFLPLLKKSDEGRIVNVSSTLGSSTDQSRKDSHFYGINTLGYNTSKSALNALTVQLAKQIEGTNLKVNSVCPGWVKTDMGTDYAPKTVEQGVQKTLELATLSADGPNGGFYDENGAIAW